mmetsp:Transcript_12370/g.19030  ORF Transcript_12370/g.19030 Transcript_12370/m.19030 type:complete len:265 (+) Transcript_12370:383-1177(+)
MQHLLHHVLEVAQPHLPRVGALGQRGPLLVEPVLHHGGVRDDVLQRLPGVDHRQLPAVVHVRLVERVRQDVVVLPLVPAADGAQRQLRGLGPAPHRHDALVLLRLLLLVPGLVVVGDGARRDAPGDLLRQGRAPLLQRRAEPPDRDVRVGGREDAGVVAQLLGVAELGDEAVQAGLQVARVEQGAVAGGGGADLLAEAALQVVHVAGLPLELEERELAGRQPPVLALLVVLARQGVVLPHAEHQPLHGLGDLEDECVLLGVLLL